MKQKFSMAIAGLLCFVIGIVAFVNLYYILSYLTRGLTVIIGHFIFSFSLALSVSLAVVIFPCGFGCACFHWLIIKSKLFTKARAKLAKIGLFIRVATRWAREKVL